MGTPTVANIVKSGAKLYRAPVGEALPDVTTVVYGAAWGGNWEQFGYSKEPMKMGYESDEFGIEVEEELGELRRVRVKEGMTMETILAELTAEYLQAAASNQDDVTEVAAGAAQRGYEETGLGGVVTLSEYAWGIEGMHLADDGSEFPIRVFIWKATSTVNGQLTFGWKDSDYVGIPIQIKALVDPSKSAGQKLCKFQRVTAEATS
jgi:hypothetical protein